MASERLLAPVLSRPTPDAIGPWGLGAGLWADSHALAPTTIPELAERPGRWPLDGGTGPPHEGTRGHTPL